MNGIDYSLNLLFMHIIKLLAFSLDTSLSLCGINDSLDFPLIFHKRKSGAAVKKEKLHSQSHGLHMKKN